jgi:hypothetical protein
VIDGTFGGTQVLRFLFDVEWGKNLRKKIGRFSVKWEKFNGMSNYWLWMPSQYHAL